MDVPGDFGHAALHIISFYRNGMLKYFEGRRNQCNSNVFKTNLKELGVCMADLESIQALFDAEKVHKEPSFGPNLVDHEVMSADFMPSIFLNGEEHDTQKTAVMRLVPRWKERTVGLIDTILHRHMGLWADGNERNVWALVTRLACDLFGCVMVGEALDVSLVNDWLAALLPGGKLVGKGALTALGVHARDALLKVIDSNSELDEVAKLSEGYLTSRDQLAKMMLFITVFNSIGGSRLAFVNLVARLSLEGPKLLSELRQDVRAAVGSAGGQISLEAVEQCTCVEHFVLEVLRLHPPVRLFFGRPQKECILQSEGKNFQVQPGMRLIGNVAMAQRDPTVFTCPHSFDISRYDNTRAKNSLVFSHGPFTAPVLATDHQCPGKDIFMVVFKWFVAFLVFRYDWTLERQPCWDKDKPGSYGLPDRPLKFNAFCRREEEQTVADCMSVSKCQ